MNLIDQYLKQPKNHQKQASAADDVGDAFLDATPRSFHGSNVGRHVASSVEGDSVLAEASDNVAKTAGSADVINERKLSDAEVKNYIDRLLDQSVSPKEIEAKLKKLADLNLFTHDFATSYLRDEAERGHGIAFISPNAYMDNCRDTYDRQEVKFGGVKAASVRQIKACTGCQYFQKAASGKKRCGIYQLPIVASGSELFPIIQQLTAGAKTGKAKKAALVSLANRENQRGATSKKASEAKDAPYSLSQAKFNVRSSPIVAKKQATFTVADVKKMHLAGTDMKTIYNHGLKTAGVSQANAVVKKFVSSLKGSKLKIALSQIDCTKLGGKLSSSNGIIGEHKCGSCSYRTGMHCGFTGGTLIQFPGQEKVATNHRIAEGAPVDGIEMIKDFDMMGTAKLVDIDIDTPDYIDVELFGPSKIDL